MPTESTPDGPAPRAAASAEAITVRPFAGADRPSDRRIVGRLDPGPTAAPRDPAAMTDDVRRLAAGEVESPSGLETFVAVDPAGALLGLLALYPSNDSFTGHPRADVETLVVAPEAEGRGVGQALTRHDEAWARAHGMAKVSLNVFAGNDRAFHERAGYRPDHVRMVERLET